MSALEFEQLIEQNHSMLAEFIGGNVGPAKTFFSHRGDVTLANPFFPIALGWEKVSRTLDASIIRFRDGKIVAFETIAKQATPELAYTVEVERFRAKVGESKDVSSISLRVTSVFRPEDGVWRLLHRHADPIMSEQRPESVVQK